MNKSKRTKKTPVIILVTIVLALVISACIYFFVIQREPQTSKTCETFGGAVNEQCIEDYIGLTREAAVYRAELNGLVPKITKIDGVGTINTDEGGFIIYFELENNIVVKASFYQYER